MVPSLSKPTLPALHELWADFRGLPAGQSQAAAVRDFVRRTARRRQAAQDQPFYPMRAVAAFLNVPLRAVSRAYEAVQAEGLLTRLWGSGTMVAGSQPRPRRPPRSVVGMPIWLPGFVSSTGWRTLFVGLEEELRRHDMIGDFIFFQENEDIRPGFFDRLQAHHLDTVVWFVPPPSVTSTLARLLDSGIRLIVIGKGWYRHPRQQYIISREKAWRQALQQWREEGIRRVVLCLSDDLPSELVVAEQRREVRLFETSAAAAGLKWDRIQVQPSSPSKSLAAVAAARAPAVFLGVWYHAWCSHTPEAAAEFLARTRVLLAPEPPSIPAFRDRGLHADVIGFDYRAMARRVVRDLAGGTLPPGRPAVFDAVLFKAADLGVQDDRNSL